MIEIGPLLAAILTGQLICPVAAADISTVIPPEGIVRPMGEPPVQVHVTVQPALNYPGNALCFQLIDERGA